MARLPEPRREDLSPEDQAAWDSIQASRGSVRGPFLPLMHHPALAERVAAVGDLVRFHGVLSGAERELAICAAGREVEARYEWQAHAPLALKEGAREEAIEAVRTQGPTDSLSERERLIIDLVRSQYREHRIPDDLYAQAEAAFGRKGLVELIVLAGYYGMIGFVLNAFAVDLPEGVKPAF